MSLLTKLSFIVKCIFALTLVLISFKHPKYRIQKNCVDMCARDGRGGDRNLFVRKGGASQKKIGEHWSQVICIIHKWSYDINKM